MIAYFYTTVTHTADDLEAARRIAGSVTGAAGTAASFVASPACVRMGPLDPDVEALSLLAPLPEGGLNGAMIAGAVRYFRDAYGAAFLAHVHNSVRPGGWILVPYHPVARAQRTGYWSLEWLEGLLGKAERREADGQLALFRRHAGPLALPPSVVSAFLRDGFGLACDYLTDGANATERSYLELCADFLAPPMRPGTEDAPTDGRIAFGDELNAFFSNMNYSVTGAGYKTEGLRRLIDHYLPGRGGLRAVDLGGGAGFVGIELLLTRPEVASFINCEPLASTLPVARRLMRWFGPHLDGRYKVSLCAAQDYPFAAPCDVVCAFASLLYVPREQLKQTLDRAWEALRTDGILVVHENIKRPFFEDKIYYDLMFTEAELESHLSPYGQIEYYRSTDIRPMNQDQTGDLTVFRVVRKV